MNRRALIIDDEEAVCWSLHRALKAEGYDAEIAATAEAGMRTDGERPADVVFLDVRLPGMDGLTALRMLTESRPNLPVIIMTAYGDLTTAVKALQGGAFDYLTKPFDLTQALRVARSAVERSAAPGADRQPHTDEMIGSSSQMQEVFKRIALVAGHPACVLITGESGTGKELVARAIHQHSRHSDGPFLPVHVGALNPSLAESELFGHVRGAFTGANESRKGLLALADGGTVFLDEVAEIPLAVQVKLLRALETGEVLPVGSDRPMMCNFRVIAATHRNLEQLAEEGTFRHDLLFRLNVFGIHVPPLRDRSDDLPALADHFLHRFAPESPAIPEATLEHMRQMPWLGNVRELRNAVERAAIMARGIPLTPEHFQGVATQTSADALSSAVRDWVKRRLQCDTAINDLFTELLKAIEPALFAEVISRAEGNRSIAAEWLGLDRGTVRKKLNLYGLGDDTSN